MVNYDFHVFKCFSLRSSNIFTVITSSLYSVLLIKQWSLVGSGTYTLKMDEIHEIGIPIFYSKVLRL